MCIFANAKRCARHIIYYIAFEIYIIEPLNNKKNMKVDRETFAGISTPMYVLEETLLRRNLELIRRVANEAGV